ncbi:MAG TPA: hypothetical protein VF616_22670 [Duganella sp.]|uniref:hypothetical protein n=1 Tax=Duganella sp. TaxID=1904440 RepID=UPI002ED67334
MAGNFNLVAFMDTLNEGGFSEKQAKALSLALVQLMDSHLVTRDYLDLRLSELKIDLRLSVLKGELKGDIATLKAELIQWMVTILIVQTGAIAVLFKFLH